METFGHLIHRARLLKCLTLEQVGKRVGVNKAYLSGIETDTVNPPAPDVVRKLARCFGIDRTEAMKRAWYPKVPKELRPLLEVKDGGTDQPVADTTITTEQAGVVFKEVFANPYEPTNNPPRCEQSTVAVPPPDVPLR